MLSRQARRHITLPRAVFSSSPRYPTRTPERRTILTNHGRSWRQRLAVGDKRERSLATAVGDAYLNQYNQLSHPPIPPFQSPILQPFDPSSLVTIPEPPTMASKTGVKMNKLGIRGDVDEMLSVFDACIRVGKLDRAQLILQRVNISPAFSGEEKIVLNNTFLRSSINQMRSMPNPKQAEELHKWYETQLRAKGIPHTAETIASMLKASLMCARGERLNRLVRRYMGMAPNESGLRVLSMADILSDSDLAVITDICPTYNFVAEPDSFEDGFGEELEENIATPWTSIGKAASYPELTPTPQQGEGLTTLMRSLEFLTGMPDMDVSKLSPSDQREVQLQLERDSIDAALMKWRHENEKMRKMGINTEVGLASSEEGSLSQHLAAWVKVMEKRIEEEYCLADLSEKKAVKSDVDLERCAYGPLIQQSDPARLAAVTILSTLNLGGLYGADRGIVVSKLITHIGRYVQEDILAQHKEKKYKMRKRERKVELKGDAPPPEITKSALKQPVLLDEEPDHAALDESLRQPWSVSLKASVGAILLKILIETTKVKATTEHPKSGQTVRQFQPAFTHMHQVRQGRKVGVVLLNPKLVERLMKEPLGDYLAKHLPMVVEPKPWSRMNDGGFLEGKASLVRVKPGDVEQGLYANEAMKSGDMSLVTKGLDVLGKTGWRINQDVLRVMTDAWNSGKEVGNMPPLSPEFTVPPEPDPVEDAAGHKIWRHAVKEIENERSGMHSQRCFMNLQLEIARAFRNQTMYFPHNVDYRGRAYPIPTYLNHMGADHTRGLLNFAKGKALGKRGLRWLKIHLANVYGLDKASFDDREAFTNDNIANIVESTEKPFEGSKWWLGAEEPWQCLAACFELSNALKLDDPSTYVSHLPIQQDGTCNGLQHYAALGGDTWGAQQVNLEPGDKPADVYSAVADLVKQGIAKEAKAKDPFALAMEGKVTRKVVKQTVMTNVYGVTFAGAKKQVCKQLDALYPNLGKEHDTTNMFLSSYVAKHIFTALATMFRGAHDIQYWLGEVGGRVCQALTASQLNQIAEEYAAETANKTKAKSSSWTKTGVEDLAKRFRSTVVWTTPLRMPVVQPYRKSTTKELRTCLQAIAYQTSDQTDPVNRKKQLQGFPPNFIHSLDASHMLLSALECHNRGLTFAAVHDSFWSHAADIDVMNSVLRDAFIKIHEDDVIGRLAAEFETRHKGSLYLAHINADSPVGKKIKLLRKNSNLSVKDELLLEHKRNSLRLSGRPWDLEAAKQIVTPASVYEDMAANEVDLEIKQEVAEISLGLVPDAEAKPAETEDVTESLVYAEDAAELAGDANLEDAGEEVVKIQPKKKIGTISLWLPLTIPAIPKKVCYTPLAISRKPLTNASQGDFEVSRLRESQYFFS